MMKDNIRYRNIKGDQATDSQTDFTPRFKIQYPKMIRNPHPIQGKATPIIFSLRLILARQIHSLSPPHPTTPLHQSSSPKRHFTKLRATYPLTDLDADIAIC